MSLRSHLFFPLRVCTERSNIVNQSLLCLIYYYHYFFFFLPCAIQLAQRRHPGRSKTSFPFRSVAFKAYLLRIVVRVGLFIRRLLISCSLASSGILVDLWVPQGLLSTMTRTFLEGEDLTLIHSPLPQGTLLPMN